MTKVKVLLNASRGGFFGYEPGMELHEAIAYDAPDGYGLDEAFETFNIGEDDLAAEYRAGKNRSLSVGDVVVLDDKAYACDSFGWTALDEVPAIAPGSWYDAVSALKVW